MQRRQGLAGKRITEKHSSKLNSAWIGLLNFCAVWSLPPVDQLDEDSVGMSLVVGAYVQYLYDCGRPYSHAKSAVLAVQNKFRHMRRNLQIPWDFLTTWALELPLAMRRPAPVQVVWAVFANSIISGLSVGGRVGYDWIAFAVELLCAFFGLMRPNEFLNLRSDMILFHSGSSEGEKMLIKVLQPKNRRAMGKSQIVIITNKVCIRWMRWLLASCRDDQVLLTGGRHKFARLLGDALDTLGLDRSFLVPASLRAGGATYMFVDGMEVARLRLLGRWKCVNTLEHYVQEAASTLINNEIPQHIESRIRLLLKSASFLRKPPKYPLHKR